MECKTQDIANVTLFQVEGRIDHATAKAFESALLPQLTRCIGEDRKLLLDWGQLVYISSAGLRILMMAAKQCRKQNGKMVLAALQPVIQEVFRISRFDTVFEVYPTVRGALESISPAAASVYGDR
jgi:anti-sigma B factor antagonist/stage II sporulation protein AA (anti-sigma F factor antagonist)